MCVKYRLKAYLKEKEITQNFFSDAIGASSGYVNAISKGIGPDKMPILMAKFPDLNIEWLLTGEGQMLNTNLSQEAPETKEADSTAHISDFALKILLDEVEFLKSQLEVKDDQIHNLIMRNSIDAHAKTDRPKEEIRIVKAKTGLVDSDK